jgi:hypothetical protein
MLAGMIPSYVLVAEASRVKTLESEDISKPNTLLPSELQRTPSICTRPIRSLWSVLWPDHVFRLGGKTCDSTRAVELVDPPERPGLKFKRAQLVAI